MPRRRPLLNNNAVNFSFFRPAPQIFNMIDNNIDQRVRLAAFDWLSNQIKVHGDVIPRAILANGFEFEGKRVPLIMATRYF